MRQFLIESLLLAVGGAAVGALVAQFVSRGLIASITTSNRPLFVGLGVDLKVLGFMTGLAILTCILFGLVPALRATGLELASSIRSGGRSMTAAAA